MDQEAATQAYISRHSGPFAEKVLGSYMKSPEGRLRLAHSMIHPARLMVEYTREGSKIQVEPSQVQTRIEDYKVFLAEIPSGELGEATYIELQGYLTALEALPKTT